MTVVLVITVLAAGAGVSAPLFLKAAVDALSHVSAHSTAMGFFFGYAVFLLLGKIFNELKFLVYARWEQSFVRNLLSRSYALILASPATFLRNHSSGELTARTWRGVFGCKVLLFDSIFHFIPLLLESMMIFAMVSLIEDAKVGMILALGLISYAIIMIYSNTKILEKQKEVREINVKTEGYFNELIRAWTPIKLLAYHQKTAERLQNQLRGFETVYHAFYWTRGLYGMLSGALLATVCIAINYLSISSYSRGETTLGSVLMINSYLLQIMKPMESVGILVRSITQAYSEFLSLHVLLPSEEKKSLTPAANRKQEKQILVLRSVSMGLRLRKVNFSAHAGEKILIVGDSGSGKSSLLSLISGLESNFSGEMTVNKQIVTSGEEEIPRFGVTYITSDMELLPRTVEDNLNLVATAEQSELTQILLALRLVERREEIDDFLIRAVDTLSDGQKQRIRLAQFFQKTTTPVALFDEPTRALDSDNELAVIKLLLSNREQTVIIVSHNASLAQYFDSTYRMSEGQLIAVRSSEPKQIGKEIVCPD